MDPGLEDKVCVVTGAARGIGAAIAEGCVRAGGRVAILDLDEQEGEATRARLASEGPARFYRIDVTSEASVAAVARQVIDDLGGVDVLVNNAGISRLGPSMDFPIGAWNASLDVMATGVFLCCREFGKGMRESGGGAIVNISSINGIVAFPMRLAYSAAKAAVISMTKVLAVEWASYGIRVNAVAPGCTRTSMLDDAVAEGLIDPDAYIAHTPLGRFAAPAEIADAVLYLASARSAYVTGQVIAADGGWTAFGWVPWSGDPARP